MIYKEHIGPYHKIITVIEEVEKWARGQNIDCSNSFGEYIDDPQVVDHDRLRSRGGCVVTTVPETLPRGYATQTLPEKQYVVAEFEGAPSIGPLKVYPQVREYMASHNLQTQGSVFEIYMPVDNKKMRTTYLFSFQK
jgi:effector-binding domain-containing protein